MRRMRKLLKKRGFAPRVLVADRLPFYGAAFREFRLSAEHVQAKRKNNRAESSHVQIGRRERRIQGFRSPACRHLTTATIHRILRDEAFAAWRNAVRSAG
jgi:transposase-like protein